MYRYTHNMALVTYTLLPSKNKDRKGAKYPLLELTPRMVQKPFLGRLKTFMWTSKYNTKAKKNSMLDIKG